MAFKIGFTTKNCEDNLSDVTYDTQKKLNTPRKSLVQVYFPKRNMTLSYYNDRFDLHVGDLVYVDGKLEGMLGRISDVNYNFKIKLSDYKRVIALVDTTVRGRFFTAGSHFLTFDRQALPIGKVSNWFIVPASEDDEFVSGSDDSSFSLEDLGGMNVSTAVGERGQDYYSKNAVKYVCLDGVKGYAIVEGSINYEVEFEYRNGDISGLVCSCFCSDNCKHEVAVMLQLRETLNFIEKHYTDEYKDSGYFAAIDSNVLFNFAFGGGKIGSFTL